MQGRLVSIEREKHVNSPDDILLEMRTDNEQLDVTFALEGAMSEVRAHKLVLSLNSPKFKRIFNKYGDKTPLIFLNGIDYEKFKAVVDFIFTEESLWRKAKLSSLERFARSLK